jgi:hypothetical protein
MTTPEKARPVRHPLANAPYVIAFTDGTPSLNHAVRHDEAADSLADAFLDGRPYASCVCGCMGELVTAWGSFDRENERLVGERCPQCAWIVSIERGAIDEELAALTPRGTNFQVLSWYLKDPLITRHICEAIIARAQSDDTNYDLAHAMTIQLLAHAVTHAPTPLYTEQCAEAECDHAECPPPTAAVSCAACSLTAGVWAGEYVGTYLDDCTIVGPCSATITLAARFGIPWAVKR